MTQIMNNKIKGSPNQWGIFGKKIGKEHNRDPQVQSNKSSEAARYQRQEGRLCHAEYGASEHERRQ